VSITAKIYDLAANELADISSIALEKTMKRRLSQQRVFTIQAPSGSPLLKGIAGDGYRIGRRGNRQLIVWEDGGPGDPPIFRGRITNIERNGGPEMTMATIVAQTPLATELGYDGSDQAGRPVRDATGNFIDPTFTGTGSGGAGVISGPDLIKQVLTNSKGTDPESGAHPGEGPLAIDLTTGTFDLDIPPAIDLSVIDVMDWPVLIGDFIQQLVATGVVDVDERPVDPSEGLDPFIMVALSAVSALGSDKTATVHFDYFTGDRNAIACRHVEDFSTINNKLYDYLGPRLNKEHWRGNITPGSPGTTVDPSASRALYGSEFMSIRVIDSLGSEDSSRPLYIALWNAEQGFRVEPRDMLYITPNPKGKSLFDAPTDFDVGDLITVNVGDDFGLALAATQRVYGYDKTWSREDVATLSALITSADEE
jgi:hypothetical protein